MRESFRPTVIPDSSLLSPTEQTQGEVLPQKPFDDLYRLVKDEGLPYFVRLRGDGDVELYLVFESIESFSESTRDAVSIEYKTYQNKLLAVIWTLADPIHPLGFPLSFDIQKETDRFMALQMLEQASVQIHYLSFENDQITHIFTEAVTFSSEEKERVEGYIRRLYEGGLDNQDSIAEEEVKEVSISTIDAHSLPDQALIANGIAYLLQYRLLVDKQGEEAAQNLVMSTVQQAMLVIRRHARSEVRESSFTVWVAQKAEVLSIIVSPALYDLFEVVHTSEEEANPFSRFLLALPEFMEACDTSPIQQGAYPILRYVAGKLFHLELNEETMRHLADLYQKQAFSGSNPYQSME